MRVGGILDGDACRYDSLDAAAKRKANEDARKLAAHGIDSLRKFKSALHAAQNLEYARRKKALEESCAAAAKKKTSPRSSPRVPQITPNPRLLPPNAPLGILKSRMDKLREKRP